MKRAIEEYFPIIDINRLAVPERNAFKPIYTMHKWFARRSSSVFRAILLGAMKPAGTDIMEEFYKDHTNDADTKGKVILDPFMGGGTTVVEALRLGCKVIGIDLNPVAWFIVKTEVEPVDLEELQGAFDRLAERRADWSGKPLKETLLSLYKTECPACGNTDADIIYTFWVKLAPCTTGTCKHETPLFSDYIIARKKPSIRYLPDSRCPKCAKTFDWEKEPAALVGDERLMISSGKFSAGEGRGSARWAYSAGKTARCPWCGREVAPVPKKGKAVRKKVLLSILFCPHCEEVWQFRGELPESVECPSCKKGYNPAEGNLPDKGKFMCRGTCSGNVDSIIAAIRTLPEDRLLRTQPYGIEGYCRTCAGDGEKEEESNQEEMFEGDDAPSLVSNGSSREGRVGELTDHPHAERPASLLSKNKGKFFKRVNAVDLALYQKAVRLWEDSKSRLPYPKSEIPFGEKTKSGLLSHHYRYWHQMFNDRQLLALSTLLKAIDEEKQQSLREMLLLTMSATLERNNMFCRFFDDRNTIQGNFDRHDYAPKLTPAENSPFGHSAVRGTFANMFGRVISGIKYRDGVYDWVVSRGRNEEKTTPSLERIRSDGCSITSDDARELADITGLHSCDAVITDPPYAGNVNYSELSDFFYVWLRLSLSSDFPQFLPELTPKSKEIVENATRGLSNDDFRSGLSSVFSSAKDRLDNDGILAFTYHHSGEKQWVDLCEAVSAAGFVIESVYPIHGEKESSLLLQNSEGISYDLIHVCRKRESGSTAKRSWASVRQEVRQRAREEARRIESGRYGREPLSPADINILLIGKCLELYSKHYGAVVDYKDEPVPLRTALEEIKMLVDQLIAKQEPLPPELEDIDVGSYVYFRALCGNREIKSDDVNKLTRGIIEVSELKDAGLLVKGREKRGRTFEVKQPVERLNELKQKFQSAAGGNGRSGSSSGGPGLFDETEGPIYPKEFPFVDYVHLLLGLAETGENVLPWLERFRGMKSQIRAALEFLMDRNKNFAGPAKKILGLIDEKTLFVGQ